MEEYSEGEAYEAPLTAGQQLRAAREEKGLSLEEIASATRIPVRHLESLEEGDYSRMPAPTYSLGFARNYAAMVGLDREAIAAQLREELGGSTRPPAQFAPATFEPADPKRVMPMGVVLGVIAALLIAALVVSWLLGRTDDEATPAEPVENVAAPVAPAPVVAPEVALTAAAPIDIIVKDGMLVLKQGMIGLGERYVVPATAADPTLTTADTSKVAVTVGGNPVTLPAGRANELSLKPDALTAAATAPAVQPAPVPIAAPAAPAPARPKPAPRRAAPTPSAPAAPVATPPSDPTPAPTPTANAI